MDIYDYFKSLSRPKKVLFRQTIIKKAEISTPSFYKKMSERKFTKAETFFIEHIIEVDKASWAG